MKSRSIFVIGDSISLHYGPYLEKAVANKFNYDRKRGADGTTEDLETPEGANGGDSNQVLRYLKKEKDNGIRHDILLLNCGLHDIRRNLGKKGLQVELSEYKKNIDEIISLAASISDKAIWIESTPVVDEIHNSISKTMKRYNSDLEEYNAAAVEIMEARGISVIPLNAFTKELGNGAYCDHIHFNEGTREKQAVFIAEFLENL